MVTVYCKSAGCFEKCMKRFKKKTDKNGIPKEARERFYFEKKSDERRRKAKSVTKKIAQYRSRTVVDL